MALLGLPAMRFLYSRDRDEKLLLLALLDRALHYDAVLRHNLAVEIVNLLGKASR